MNARLVRRALVAAAIGAAAWAVIPVAISAGKLTLVPSLQCPMGCGAVIYDVLLSNSMARTGSNVSLTPQETPGYMYNIRQMDKTYDEPKTKITTFGTEDMVLQLGPMGGQGILKDSLPEPITHHFKFLWQIAATAQGRFFVTFDPNIKTIDDMKGKRVDLGLLTQSDWGLSGRMVLDAYGITSENTKISYVTPAVMTSQLIAGTTDVATSGILGDAASNKWSPVGPLVKLVAAAKASGRKLHYISVDPAKIEKLNQQYGMTLFTVTLKPHTLPLQDEPFTMGLNRAYHAVTTDFPPEIAYELTKATLQHGAALKKEGGFWSFWSAKGMVAGLTECNTNPGSIKAFKEAGIWKYRDKGGPPAKIPGC
jgi:TRAP-type uncharacterized transport system substrate-binding protein